MAVAVCEGDMWQVTHDTWLNIETYKKLLTKNIRKKFSANIHFLPKTRLKYIFFSFYIIKQIFSPFKGKSNKVKDNFGTNEAI